MRPRDVYVLPMLEAEARERQAHGQTAPGKTLRQTFAEAIPRHSDAGETHGRGQLRERLPEANFASQGDAGKATEHAAKMAGTNPRYATDRGAEHDPAPSPGTRRTSSRRSWRPGRTGHERQHRSLRRHAVRSHAHVGDHARNGSAARGGCRAASARDLETLWALEEAFIVLHGRRAPT